VSLLSPIKGIFAQTPMLPKDQQVDTYVQDRITRSEARLQELLPGINERYEMWRGNQYAYVDSKNKLAFLPTKTTPTGAGKRPWLSRSVENLLIDIVQHEVSAVTQRIPAYEVAPTAADPNKRSAAKTSAQVAAWGYEQWGNQLAAVKAVTHAVVGQEAFAWPYFDTSVGPMIMGKDGKTVVGRGEIKNRIYGPQDVMWEPGVRYEDSPYHILVDETTLQDVVSTPGFLGEPVQPDSEISRGGRRGWGKAHNTRLVRRYNYLEKPTRTYPTGRWITIAGGRIIAKERPYPVPEGDALVPLSYIIDPDNDRDMGLVQHLLDPQRVYNDAWNKIIEWKNLALNPQLFVAPGVLRGQVITSEPGAVWEIPDPQNNIKWREVPQIPAELFRITQDMDSVIARLAAQNDIPQNVEAAKAIQTLIERDMARRQSFVAQVARWHGQVASRQLYLVQQHYTEPRLLRIKGRWSADTITDFRGAQLLGQIDVRVAPGSIEPRTKAAMEQKVLAFADRGWITSEQAMAAINGGFSGDLVSSYELDVGRATRIIARIKAGEHALYGTPEKPAPSRLEMQMDPATGQPLMQPDPQTGAMVPVQVETPDFMPRKFDNIAVQRHVFEDWMKTEEFESLSPQLQQVATDIYMGMLKIEAEKQAQAAQAQMASAEAKGMMNASRGSSTAQPDAPSAQQGGGDLPTPNQPANQNVPQAA
jgi:hypothetical protein